MLDFLMISTRSTKRGVIEIYPKFIVGRHTDLMIRGGDFYAIWIEEKGLWSTDEQDVIRLIDKELDDFAKANKDKFEDHVRVLHMWDAETGMIDNWHKYCQRQQRDYYHSLDETLIFANQETKKEDYASKKLGYPLEEGPMDNFEELINKGEEDIQAHYSTGTSSSIIPNRLSYWFNFRGPSVQVDTACSGSITALDIACQAIRSKKCNMALVGGISLILTPSRHISFSKMRMLSNKGLCNTFDDSADGYVRGEGAGLLLLKPLKNALADHDNIHAIIRGCAINHGGKVRSLTYPNPNAQAEVIVNAFRQAEVSPEDINYIEAHGTGTPKGDPIEMQGLMQAFTTLYGNRSVKSETCCLGSCKPNIGHLESAAGVAGIIKTVLSMENRRIPPLHGYKKLNSRMNLDNTPFYIAAEPSEFKHSNENSPLIVGVSSFGFGGTNGHIVLQEAPKNETEENSDKKLFLICLSAKDKNVLHEKARNLLEWLSRNSDSNLSDVEATLINGREHFDNRVAIICSNVNDLSEKLNKFLNSPISQSDIFVGLDCDTSKNTDDTSHAPIGEKLGSLDYKTILKNIATVICSC